MNKKEFLEILRKRLSYLNETEIKRHLDYYEEAINDRMDDGMTEFEAVKDIGAIADIVNTIKEEYPDLNSNTSVKEEVKEVESKVEENKVVEKNIEVKNDVKKDNSSLITYIVLSPVFFVLCILAISFIIIGIGFLFSVFLALGSPVSTILTSLSLSFGFLSFGILFVVAIMFILKLIKKYVVRGEV